MLHGYPLFRKRNIGSVCPGLEDGYVIADRSAARWIAAAS